MKRTIISFLFAFMLFCNKNSTESKEKPVGLKDFVYTYHTDYPNPFLIISGTAYNHAKISYQRCTFYFDIKDVNGYVGTCSIELEKLETGKSFSFYERAYIYEDLGRVISCKYNGKYTTE